MIYQNKIKFQLLNLIQSHNRSQMKNNTMFLIVNLDFNL